MFQVQYRETRLYVPPFYVYYIFNFYLKSCCVLQDHYDDKRDKIMFHNTTTSDVV